MNQGYTHNIIPNHELSVAEQYALYTLWIHGGLTKEKLGEFTERSSHTITKYVQKFMKLGYAASMTAPSNSSARKQGRPVALYLPIRARILEEFGWPDREASAVLAALNIDPRTDMKSLSEDEQSAVYQHYVYMTWGIGDKQKEIPLAELVNNLITKSGTTKLMLELVGVMMHHMHLNDYREFVEGQPGATAFPDRREDQYAMLLFAIKTVENSLDALYQLAMIDAWRGTESSKSGQLTVLHNVAEKTFKYDRPAIKMHQARLMQRGLKMDMFDGVPEILMHFGKLFPDAANEEQLTTLLEHSKIFAAKFNELTPINEYQELRTEVYLANMVEKVGDETILPPGSVALQVVEDDPDSDDDDGTSSSGGMFDL